MGWDGECGVDWGAAVIVFPVGVPHFDGGVFRGALGAEVFMFCGEVARVRVVSVGVLAHLAG
jgi:hypothetical protein